MTSTKVKMVCRVFPEGQKLTSVIVNYSEKISGDDLAIDTFYVENRHITGVHIADCLSEKSKGSSVVIELDPSDKMAELTYYKNPGPHGIFERRVPVVSVCQQKDIVTEKGEIIPKWNKFLLGTEDIELLVDDFTQHIFHSGRTGQKLPYNLFLPKGYEPEKEYPLVMFIHDRGPLSCDIKTTLRQGVGALVWVEPEEQKQHSCIVIAPQYERVPFGNGDPDMLETTFDLYEDIMARYAVDKKRLYITGQSMGCMSAIQMGIRRPGFFTAYLLVAGQWDPEAMETLKDEKMLIIVSRGDPRAFPGMNDSLGHLREKGASVAFALWDQTGGKVPEEQARKLCEEKADILYAVLKTEKRDVSCHMDTWKVAYNIKAVHEWLFKQCKAE